MTRRKLFAAGALLVILTLLGAGRPRPPFCKKAVRSLIW